MKRLAHFTWLLFMLASVSLAGVIPNAVNGQQLPSLAPMLDRITPAVVNISTRSAAPAVDQSILDLYRFFYGEEAPNRAPSEPTSLGSGVIIDSKLGLVVTNYHVIENASEISVTLRDSREFKAELLGTDPKADIALLKIPADNLRALKWANSDGLRVGDFCVAIGNPFGLGQTVTSGIVSALRRSGLGIEDFEDFIQTDASINPGNSGGALVNLNGELIGINTAIVGPSGGNVGIGFAIPSNMAQSIISQLLEYGEVRRGMLGISAAAINPRIAQEYQLPRDSGVLVSNIEAGSPAEQAGLRVGDIIVRVDGVPVKTVEAVINRVGLVRIGQQISLTVVRNGREFNVDTTVAKLASLGGLLSGVELQNAQTRAGRRYVRVNSLLRDSIFAQYGIQPGDIILSVNRRAVETVGDVRTLISSNDPSALLLVQTGQQTRYVEVR